jgi:putative membrane protein insertion efficiency factor
VNTIAQPNPARPPAPFTKALLLVAIRMYQAFLSPLAFSACKFHPSCSRYAYEAVEIHCVRRGIVLALKRLWRCRPFAAGGYDPVPDTGDEAQ